MRSYKLPTAPANIRLKAILSHIPHFLETLDITINKISEENNVGVFSFKPLPKGFGNTLGNSLRRVLLTSIPGGAITQLKLNGASHEFATIPGIKEDVS